MPGVGGGTSFLRQIGHNNNNNHNNHGNVDRSISLDPRRASVADLIDEDDNNLLPRGSRRRLSVTDKEVSKWFSPSNAASTSIDLITNDRTTSSLIDVANCRDKDKFGVGGGRSSKNDNNDRDDLDRRHGLRLPHILASNSSSMFSSRSHYAHLEQTASVESAENKNIESAVASAVASAPAPAASVAAATRITSARQRMRTSRSERETITFNSSNEINNDETNDEQTTKNPNLLPHHPHSPPAIFPNNNNNSSRTASPSLDRKISSIGNLLTVPELISCLPTAPGNNQSISANAAAVVVVETQKSPETNTNSKHNNQNKKSEKKKKIRDDHDRDRNNFGTPTASTSSVLSRNYYKSGGGANSSGGRQNTIDQIPNGPGVFLNDGQRRIDFILVYQSGNVNSTTNTERQRRYFEKNLQQEGLILELDPLDGNEEAGKLCFLKIHCPWDTLCRSAEMLQMKMPLRNAELPQDLLSSSNTGTGANLGVGGIFELIFDALCSSWFKFNDTENLLIGRQSNYVTAQFTRARIEQFLILDTETFFTSTQRIRIVYDIMQRGKCDPDNSKKRGLQWLLKNGVYSAAYPPHDGGTETRHLNTNEPSSWSQRQILKHTWANFNRVFKPQPLNLVRTYFGEKVGFYFAWLGFYTQMLVFPSVVGVICFLYGVLSLPSNPVIIELCSSERTNQEPANLTMCPVCVMPYCLPWTLKDACEGASWNYRFDHESHVFMAVFTLVWATLFMELWKRKEAEFACEWDAYDAEQEEEGMRPEYEARTQIIRISPVTNEEEPYIPACKRILWGMQSLSGLFTLIMCVVAALVALITVRILLYGMLGNFGGQWKHYQFEFASLIIHVLTFVVVMTLGWVYEKAAHRLTELECPRTQADYLSSYIWKVFIFEILNNFAPVLYAALIRGRSGLPQHQTLLLEMCDPGGCLNEVVQAIAILLLARLLISNAAEIGVPFLKSLLKTMRLGAAVNPEHEDEPTVLRNLPRWQKDYTLNETNMDGVYAEYLEMMVQFGYVTLFVSAFPLAPLICLLNNIVEIRIDATNFVTSFRRPLPTRVSGIRIWRRCLNIMIKLSVLCNGAFLAFTSELIPKIVYRFWYSRDGSTFGYMKWSLAKVDTSDWLTYLEHLPNSTECYYRDFRQTADSDYGPSLIWWQVMVARLAFFIIFVIAFYFIQWLCDFLVPDVPQHVKLRVDRANFLAKQALYGHEMRGGPNSNSSNTPMSKSNLPLRASNLNGGSTPQRKTTTMQNGPWSTTTSSGLGDHYLVQQSNHSSTIQQPKSRPSSPSPLRLLTVANGELLSKPPPATTTTTTMAKEGNNLSNGFSINSTVTVNGYNSTQQQQQKQRLLPNFQSSFITGGTTTTTTSGPDNNHSIFKSETTYV